MVAFIGQSDITKTISDYGKMLKLSENIGKTIYWSISTLEQSRHALKQVRLRQFFYSHSQKSSQSRALSIGTISDVSVR